MTSYIIIMMNLRGVAASVVDNQLLIEDASSPERPLKKVSSSMTHTVISLVAQGAQDRGQLRWANHSPRTRMRIIYTVYSARHTTFYL